MSIEEYSIKKIVSKTVDTLFDGIKVQMGPSKKELKMRIEDLEKQIQELNKNNKDISDFYEVVIDDLCEKIGSTYSFFIEADTICIVNNSGQIGSGNSQSNYIDNNSSPNSTFDKLISRMNKGIDEKRRKYPRGRVDEYTE